MAAKNLVIVESPAKAKTINKYLGDDFVVIASFGHIRDLPPKDGSVRPDEGFAMDWQMGDRAKKPIAEIVKLAKESETVYLATDPDREGEAISWHIREVLKDKKILDKITLKRVTFNEITKTAVQEAFKNARDLDIHLIEAYLARRALDYLVGFNLSPVLWRKLPGAKSAGRVQSVALRLICEREMEIETFKSDEYWSIEALLQTKENKSFTGRLFAVDGNKLGKLDIKNETDAKALAKRIEDEDLSVSTIERKQVKRHPAPPFITSTLQQEASRKLNFGATRTMRTAQRLYEGVDIGGETVGLITYMRTDGVTLSNDAIFSARKLIERKYGENFVPKSPRMYKSKAKNAQEAHEAIRPTDIFRTPQEVAKYVGPEEARLYELIWKRTVACQMESALLDQVSVDIEGQEKDLMLRATGSIVAFDGFFSVYKEDFDDKGEEEDSDDDKRLPALHENDPLKTEEVLPNQHFTQPPPRYTEASLVKKMEEMGIGRPSTYASIIQVLQDRNYVVLDKKRFTPESRGRLVVTFLKNFFKRYVEYNFTADLENQLDDVSAGTANYKDVLSDFWQSFSSAIAETKDLRITHVIDALDEDLAPHLFPEDPTGKTDPRKCPSCADGRLSLKIGKFGAFVGCSNYPECKFTRPFMALDGNDTSPDDLGPKELGLHPETGLPVSLRRGPYGPYVQMDPPPEAPEKEPEPEPETDAKGKTKAKKKKKKAAPKPKRTSIPQGMSPDDIDLDKAVALLTLPRDVGDHPESGKMIKAGIGRFGPYLVHDGKFKSIPKDDPDGVLTIGLNRAVDLLAQPSARGGFGELKNLGEHPADKKAVTVNKGRFGPYVKHGKTNATIPKSLDPQAVTLEQAIEWLQEKEAKGGKKAPAKKKAAAKKPAAKKTTTKKKPATTKKAPAKKTTKKSS
jgi:DNA topoisomerase-1